MTRTRSFAFATMLLGSLLLTAPLGAAAQSPPQDAPRQPGAYQDRMLGRLKDRLGLSEDQKLAIKQIYERDAQSRRERWQKLRAANHELRQLALQGGDEAAIRAKSEEVQRLQGEALEARVRTLQEIAPILTPEQRDKLAAMQFGPRGRRGRDQGRS